MHAYPEFRSNLLENAGLLDGEVHVGIRDPGLDPVVLVHHVHRLYGPRLVELVEPSAKCGYFVLTGWHISATPLVTH